MSPFTTHNHSRVPPGFRFHPTDEELVGYYLQKKVAAKKIDLDVIREIDLYKMEPWDLQDRCRIGSAEQNEWYFFSHKDKKYPTGTRTNRATAAGFWKATGRDKAIRTMYKVIGMRKTLVFYKGRAPNGQKTDWIMHEYRLEDDQNNNNGCEDGWVVCRVFKKRNCHKGGQTHASAAYDEEVGMMSEMNGVRKKLSEDENSYMQSLLCKQEAMSISKTLASSAEQNNSYTMCDPFSALPQLESPKMEVGNSLRNSYPSPFSLNTTEFEVPDAKSGITEDRQGGSDPVTDWRMVDRIAAAQLSQEDKASKEMRSYLTSDTDTLEDVGVFLGLSKHQNHGDYSSNCDADLWNFGR